jgi:hypothetical protein
MKRLLVILFLAFSYIGIAQNDYVIVDKQNSGETSELQSTPKLGYDKLAAEYEATSMQLAKTNYYLDKYARQALSGDILIIAGSVFTSMAAFCGSVDTALLCTVVGLGAGITGYVMKLSAYNHIQSNRLKYDGFKVTYKL